MNSGYLENRHDTVFMAEKENENGGSECVVVFVPFVVDVGL